MLIVDNLSAAYPSSPPAFADITFQLAQGEKTALIGANGAGKSALLLTLCGVLPVLEGSVSVAGITLTKKTLSVLREKTALVFQNPDEQLFMPTVIEDVLFGPQNFKPEENHEDAACEVLKKLNIYHLKDRPTRSLSGGEKRLCALASVLVMEPQVLLLDEPTAFLDPRGKRTLLAILQSLPQTILLATHDTDFAERLVSRVLVLQSGRLRLDSPTRGILQDSATLEGYGL